jgi:hypothetical protein
MRRLALAVVIGTLALSACSDQPQEALTGPSLPRAAKKCLVDPFPFSTIVAQILNVYPDGLRGDAIPRTTTIKNNWDGCRPVPAQQGAVDFISGLNQAFQNNTLAGTDAQRTLLIKTLLESVGFPAPPTFPLGPDYGVGFYDPTKTTPTLITTAGNTALTELGFGAFSEPTLIVIGRRPDQPGPLNFTGNQFPPFFDYNAINASGNHFLENGPTAIVAFCFLAGVEYPDYEEARIGHNPPSAEPTFEVLEPVDIRTEGERPDLGEALDCGNLQPTPGSNDFGYLGLGMPGLASAGWKAASHYLRPVARSLFLPAALNAATLGSLGPIAGKAGSFSPFGVVQAESAYEIEDASSPAFGSGEDGPYFVGEQLDPCGECSVRFKVTDEEGEPVVETPVTVRLVPEGDELSGTLQQHTSGSGIASFGDLAISEPGTYRLRVTAPNATPYITPEFTVYEYRLGFITNPSGQSMGYPLLSWYCGGNCYPEVRLLDANGGGVSGVAVTAVLNQVDGSGDIDQESSTNPVTTMSGEGGGLASFDDLVITEQGYYSLTFTAPGAPPLKSGTFSSLSFE